MHDVSRVAARPARQFTLRAFFCFVLLVGALCGVIAAVDTSTTAGLLTFAVAVRLLPTLVVGTVIGLLVGSISKSLVAALVGVVLADVVWRGFFSVVATSVDTQDLVLNPLVVIGLVACPPAAAKSRARALTIGISLSIVLPLMVATGILWKMPIGPGVRGTGLAAVMTVLMALAAVLTGVSGTLIARLLFEAVQRMHQSGKKPSPAGDP